MLQRLPKGDGRPILVLPGFSASDRSTEPLRWFLRDLGYNVFAWELGRNIGPTKQIVDGLKSRLELIHSRFEEPVTVIGWSLGGIYARALADHFASRVRHVITLGSPFRISDRSDTNAAPLYSAMSDRHAVPNLTELHFKSYRGAPKVPSTSIFTRTDGVVPWRSCVDDAAPRSENIEVRGSHMGLGHNSAALLVLADRLRLELDEWRPYEPGLFAKTLFSAKVFAA